MVAKTYEETMRNWFEKLYNDGRKVKIELKGEYFYVGHVVGVCKDLIMFKDKFGSDYLFSFDEVVKVFPVKNEGKELMRKNPKGFDEEITGNKKVGDDDGKRS